MNLDRRALRPAALLLALAALPLAGNASELPPGLADKLPELAEQWGRDPDIVAAVKAHNAKNISLAEIQELDGRWQDTSGFAPFMAPYFDNPAADALARLESRSYYVLESFAMGNQGGIVGATNKPSDYWQGDEAKFTESFKGGAGAIHTGDVEFDESAQAYLVQVSVPVMDGDAAIGAITIGIDLGSWE